MSVSTINHASHVSWDCTYHVIIVPKYRKKVLFGFSLFLNVEVTPSICEANVHGCRQRVTLRDGVERSKWEKYNTIFLLCQSAWCNFILRLYPFCKTLCCLARLLHMSVYAVSSSTQVSAISGRT
jgi:hypothetical protein